MEHQGSGDRSVPSICSFWSCQSVRHPCPSSPVLGHQGCRDNPVSSFPSSGTSGHPDSSSPSVLCSWSSRSVETPRCLLPCPWRSECGCSPTAQHATGTAGPEPYFLLSQQVRFVPSLNPKALTDLKLHPSPENSSFPSELKPVGPLSLAAHALPLGGAASAGSSLPFVQGSLPNTLHFVTAAFHWCWGPAGLQAPC